MTVLKFDPSQITNLVSPGNICIVVAPSIVSVEFGSNATTVVPVPALRNVTDQPAPRVAAAVNV